MMDQLYRLRLRPRGAWRTPWQADTLIGSLCWQCVRLEGEEVLRTELIEPMLAGSPPFVLSDAFPGDFLPIPLSLRLIDWPLEERKTVNKAGWLRFETFRRACNGAELELSDLITDSPIVQSDQTRNTLDRLSDTTGEEGSLFTLPEYRLIPTGLRDIGVDWISIYLRVRPGARDLLLDLFEELANVGFGADVSVGKGAFEFYSGFPELEPVELDTQNNRTVDTKSVVVLSTFQPGRNDPTEGLWETFVKFGKLGPGLTERRVDKHPLLLMRPGAVISGMPMNTPFLGRAIPMDEVLDRETVAELRSRGVEIIHPAFGLTIPADLRLP